MSDARPSELPSGVTITDVFGDFLRYLNECVRDYIKEREVDGSAIWEAASPAANYVLTLPDDWGAYQQYQMRTSAIKGDLVPDTPEGTARVTFISEGEASFHWCVDSETAGSCLAVGNQIIICDAGSSTIGVSSFRIQSLQSLAIVKTSKADSETGGSRFVVNNFRLAMKDKLAGSKWASEEYIDNMTSRFDTSHMWIFKDKDKTMRLKFGIPEDDDDKYDIEHGFINIPGSLIAHCFEDSCREAVEAATKQLRSDSKGYVFLVGSFSASPYLFDEIKKRLVDKTSEVYWGDSKTATAVSHGAVASYLVRLPDLQFRMAKYSFGFSVAWRYDPRDEDLKVRERNVYTDPTDGCKYVAGGFECLIRKDGYTWPGRTYMAVVRRTYTSQQDVSCVIQLERYSGVQANISFKDMDDSSMFGTVGTFKIEIPKAALLKKQQANGEYWELRFMFILRLGLKNFESYVQWTEEGLTMMKPAVSVWGEF